MTIMAKNLHPRVNLATKTEERALTSVQKLPHLSVVLHLRSQPFLLLPGHQRRVPHFPRGSLLVSPDQMGLPSRLSILLALAQGRLQHTLVPMMIRFSLSHHSRTTMP